MFISAIRLFFINFRTILYSWSGWSNVLHKGNAFLCGEISKQKLKLRVMAAGYGMPKKKLLTFFDRFKKLNSFAQGTGLGLSICKSIAGSTSGVIGVDSEIGVGSYWVILPVVRNLLKGTKVPKFCLFWGPVGR